MRIVTDSQESAFDITDIVERLPPISASALAHNADSPRRTDPGFVIGAPVGALTLAPVVSRDGGRVLSCEEIEDAPHPRPSHRTEPSPPAALSLHDPNDITGRDRAAGNDYRHDRALHCRGSIIRERHSAPQAWL
jgi:hypothetical protein